MKTSTQRRLTVYAVLLLFLIPICGFGQKKVFYNKLGEAVDSLKGFDYYEIVEKQAGGLLYLTRFTPKNSLLYEGAYTTLGQKKEKDVKVGLHKTYRKEGGALWHTENYQNGLMQGERRSFYPAGQLKRIEVYDQDTFVRGDCYQEDGTFRAFTRFERMPEFPGGEAALMEFFSKKLTYPRLAKENGVQGSVILTFVVNKDGSIGNVIVLKDIGAGCGEESKRLVQSMPTWTPGYADDAPVKVRFTLPVKFRLDGRRKKKRKKD